MNVFFKYIIACLDTNYYSKDSLATNFKEFTNIFYIFVKEGYITPETQSALYYAFVLLLKERLDKI